MDPITALGMLASLSSLIRASNSLLELLKSFKDGDKEIIALFSDVSVFAEALKGFDRVLRSRQTNHNISTTVVRKALEDASRTIQELEKKIVHLSKFENTALRRMKWVQHKSSLTKLHDRVKEQSTMLQSFLTLAHAYVASCSPTNSVTHHKYRETFLNTCQQYPHFLQIRSLSADEINSDAVSTSSETTVLTSRSSTFSQRQKSVDSAPSSVGSSDSLLQKTMSNPSEEARLSLEVGSSHTGAVISRKACRYDCYCNCHIQTTAKHRGISRLASSSDQCTDRKCQAFNEATVAPSKFFRKALAQVVSSRSIKVRYDLNTFRMVSEGSDAMRYVKHGNLDKLKTCIEMGEATLWDTAPDGWSLLHVSMGTVELR